MPLSAMKVEDRLAVFKEESYRNAVRLFQDAALLYCRASYPSSFALAVTALTELSQPALKIAEFFEGEITQAA